MNKTWTDDDLRKAVKESKTFGEVVLALGLKPTSNRTRDRIRERVRELGIDWSHFKRKGSYAEDYNPFVYGVEFNTTTKRHYMKSIDYECALCGISEWLGNKLILQVDHVDGDRKNNTLENLRLLCPNCHTQTETWAKKKSAFKNNAGTMFTT